MENSMNSMSKVISSNERISGTDVSPEESGWTMYFDDFFNQHNENSCFSSGMESYLITDAAASVDNHKQVMGFSMEKTCDRLSFKKRKTKVVVVDDDLEDTASSPAYRPEKKASSPSAQMDERNGEISINGRDNNETELKKRGLCLVPLSMIVDYLGSINSPSSHQSIIK